ncbi:helix-turn-helix domain-containing protein [Oceanobacillus arenosus]|uniref:helix-turn-helix domain-containing protein n=1 Tax=Oceanobacillus arenosus TaxID=1229153 RepID=UPI0014756EAD|nr:helix-turn-helix domain-containing protein [Oceanobacillus arenosus]
MKKKSLYQKILLSLLLLIIMYTSLSVGIIFIKSKELMNYRIDSTQQSFLESSTKEMDTTLRIGVNLANQLKLNSDVNDFASMEEIDYYTITRVYQSLQDLGTAFSDFKYTIGLSKPDHELVITPNGTTSKQSFFDSLDLDREQMKQIASAQEQDRNFQLNLQYYDSKQYFTIVMNEKMNSGERISFYISYFKNSLLPNVTDEEGFGIVFGDESVSMHADEKESVHDIISLPVLKQLREDSRFSDFSSIKTSDNTIYMKHSNVLHDLYYVYSSDNAVLPVNQGINQIIWVGLISLILGGLLAFFAANRTYRPVKKLIRVFKENSVNDVEVQAGDELKYLEENYLAVKQNIHELQRIVEENNVPLKNDFLKKMMYGVLSKQAIEEGMEQYQLAFLNQPVRVAVIEFKDKFKVEKKIPSETIHLLKTQVLKYLKTELAIEFQLAIFEMDYLRFGTIIENVELEKVKKALQSAFLTIEVYSDITLIGFIGNVAEKQDSIKDSYADCVKLLEYRYALPEKSVVTMEDPLDIKETSYYYPIEKERELISYAVQGNKEKMLQTLDELLHHNMNRQLTVNNQEQFTQAIVSTIHRIVFMINEDVHKIFKDNILLTLLMCETPEQLATYMRDYFMQLLEYINQSKEEQDFAKKDELLEFVHQHYQEEISLQDLAGYLNLSTSYVSTLFKKITGENFKEYLNMYRIQVAKNLLKDKKYKISEVAESVGYTNINSFIRIFKKYEGTSPGKYES